MLRWKSHIVFKVHHRKRVRQESGREPRDWGGSNTAGHSQAVGLRWRLGCWLVGKQTFLSSARGQITEGLEWEAAGVNIMSGITRVSRKDISWGLMWAEFDLRKNQSGCCQMYGWKKLEARETERPQRYWELVKRAKFQMKAIGTVSKEGNRGKTVKVLGLAMELFGCGRHRASVRAVVFNFSNGATL